MVQKIFRNCKSCWISEMRTTQLKLLEILGAKLNGKKNFGIPREVVPFFRNFGKCCSLRYWKLRKIQNRCFAWMESVPSFYYSYNEPSSYGIRPWTPPSKKIRKVHVCWWVNAAFNFCKKYVPVRESGSFFPRLLLVHEGFRFLSLMIKQPIRRAAITFVAKKMLCALLELNETNLSVAALTCVQ